MDIAYKKYIDISNLVLNLRLEIKFIKYFSLKGNFHVFLRGHIFISKSYILYNTAIWMNNMTFNLITEQHNITL